ncbi:MAG: PQQ-binding-like beta-propeller repeat protein [Actinomycetota bacterium]
MDDPCTIPARRRRLISGAAIALTLAIAGTTVAATVATAQVSIGWTQVQGDASHTGYAADAATPPFKEGWHLSVPLGGPASTYGLSAPVVDGSSVIAVGPTSIVAADLASGRQLWSVDRDYGPSTTPAIAVSGKRRLLIYTEGFGPTPPGTSATPSGSGASTPSPSPATSGSQPVDSHVTALDLATQDPAWTTPFQLKKVSRTGVTVDGDTAFVGDHDGNVYAIDVATGVLRWTARAGGFLTNSLAVAGGEVVAAVQGSRTTQPHLIAFKESDGSTSWDVEVQGAVLASAPAIESGHVIVGFYDQTVRSYALADGAESWSARLNSPVLFTGAAAITPDAVLVVDANGEVYRLDLATGERVWDFALNETVLRSPAVVAGDRVLIASSTGHLSAIDLTSGRLVWQSDAAAGILRSLTPTLGAVVAVRGGAQPGLVAYVEDPDGSLVSVVSPTVLDLSKLLLAYAAAAVPLVLLLVLGGRAALVRMGPAFLDDDGDGDADPVIEDTAEDDTDEDHP